MEQKVDLEVEAANGSAEEAARSDREVKRIVSTQKLIGDEEVEINKNGVTWKLTGLFVSRPVCSVSTCSCVLILLIVLVVATGLINITQGSSYDWDISSSTESEQLDAFDDAVDQVDDLEGDTSSGARREISDYSKLTFNYQADDRTEIFTPERLQTICEIESLVINDERFIEFCRIRPDFVGDPTGNLDACEIPSTCLPQIFYNFSSASDYDCSTLLSEASVQATAQGLYDAVNASETGLAQFGFLLDDGTLDRGFAIRTQSTWHFGAPLEGYNSALDDQSEQFREYMEFLAAKDGSVGGVEEQLFELFDVSTNEDGLFPYYPSPYRTTIDEDGISILWNSPPMRENEFQRLVTSDLFFSIFSILFVLIWMRIHVGNTFVTAVSMLQIVASIPVTVLIYRGIYQIAFFQQLHALTLFIILGIGADDIFVFVDGWKHSAPITEERRGEASEEELHELYHERMYYTYTHTREAVFNTSFTTAFAFIATGASPLMPISTFGYFAATAIILNYAFVMTLTPSTVYVAEKYFNYPFTQCMPFLKSCAPKDKVDSIDRSAYAVARKPEEEKPTFVEKYYIPFMTAEYKGFPVVSTTLVVTLLGLGIYLLVLGLQLQPPEEQEQWFPSDHIIQKAEDSATEDFLAGDDTQYAGIDMTFGISGIDRGDFNIYEPGKNRGDAKFDNGYELADFACQEALRKACEDILTFECNEDGCDPLTTLAIPSSVKCFMPEFITFLEGRGIDRMTVSPEIFYEELMEFRNTDEPDSEPGSTWKNEIGFIDGELKYASFSFTSSLEFLSPMTEKGDVFDVADSFVSRVKRYPECDVCDCSSFMQTSGVWVWWRTEQGLVRGFYQGLAICFPVAFVVLLLSTGNVLLAFYAIVSVLFIVFGVLGFVYLLGWALGVAESVAGIIIVGFSVDYTVHLGHIYMQGNKYDFFERAARFEYASKTMVATVVAGAVTTVGAGVFLFPAQLTFFVKMATLICSTIILSYIYALGFFMGLLYVAGPQYDQGNVSPLLKWIYAKVMRKSE
uniref:SSD domain-containing protein n=1 Tax=Pinguiococcus pyrenoidosus TaxID=172671 RepID=A0A6U0VZ18_9STRA|eukprot:scaffold1277_cov253-Pinguiococcus_pyrenoidosus.AAC.61